MATMCMPICPRILLIAVVAAMAATLAAADADRPAIRPDDESGLHKTLLERPAVPVTAPSEGEAPSPAGPDLPPAGSMLIDQPCRLVMVGGETWRIARLEPLEGAAEPTACWVLPCRLLEEMQAAAAANPNVRFRVSGELTGYDQQVFVLPRKAVAQLAEIAAKPSPPAGNAPQPASQPAAAEQGPATSDEVLKHLRAERAGAPVLAPSPQEPRPPTSHYSAAPQASGETLSVTEGGLIIDRRARVLPSPHTLWWLVRFEADNTLKERPLRLLPCRLLQQAQGYWAGGAGETRVYRVSGEVTEYEGRQYLLLRKLLPDRDLGRF